MHPRNASSTLPNQSRSAKTAGIVPLPPSLAPFRTPTATRSNLHSARQPSYPTSRAFLHWRLSDDGPRARGATFMGPSSETLHITGSQLISRSLVGAPFLAKASWLYKQDAREVHRS